MNDFTFWILYNRNEDKGIYVIRTKTDDCLSYSQVCKLTNLKTKDYLYECITGFGFKILSRTFFEFANENLKIKIIRR